MALSHDTDSPMSNPSWYCPYIEVEHYSDDLCLVRSLCWRLKGADGSERGYAEVAVYKSCKADNADSFGVGDHSPVVDLDTACMPVVGVHKPLQATHHTFHNVVSGIE